MPEGILYADNSSLFLERLKNIEEMRFEAPGLLMDTPS
jgi:hypothetical protein